MLHYLVSIVSYRITEGLTVHDIITSASWGEGGHCIDNISDNRNNVRVNLGYLGISLKLISCDF